MRGINKCILVGNLTRDPVLKETTNGTAVCNFGMATGRQWKDKDGQSQEDVQFHNIVLWSGLAQTASKYLHKGSPVYIEGRITTRKYTNKEGVEKYITEIIGNEMVLMPDGNKHVSESAPSGSTTPTYVAPPKEDAVVIPPPVTEEEIDEVFGV